MAAEDSGCFFEQLEREPFLLTHNDEVVIPGGEAPFNFDPRLTLLPGRARIAVIPKLPHQLLRWYPGQTEKQLGACETDTKTILRVTKEHFSILQDIGGIAIPPHHTILGKAPDGERLAVYSMVHKIKGTHADSIADPSVLARDIAQPLLEYYEWVIHTGSEYLLRDIGMWHQYMLGHVATDLTMSSARMFLIDIDPRVSHIRDAADSDWVKNELYTLRNSLLDLGPGVLDVDNSLERASELINSLF